MFLGTEEKNISKLPRGTYLFGNFFAKLNLKNHLTFSYICYIINILNFFRKEVEKMYEISRFENFYDCLQARIIFRLKKWPVLLKTREILVFKWRKDLGRWWFLSDERLSDKGHDQAIDIWIRLKKLEKIKQGR